MGNFLGGLGESKQEQKSSSTQKVDETTTQSGSQGSTGQQRKNPWEVQAPYLQDVWGRAGDAVGWQAQNVDPALQEGWQQMTGFAGGGAQDIYSGAQGAVDFLGGTDQLDPATNPFFQQNIDAATQAIQENLGLGLNQIDQNAAMVGNLGGSRQGVAQGQAIGDATQQMGDVASRMAMENYQQGMGNITNAAQMAPMLMEMGMLPGQIVAGVGQERMGMQNPWEELMRYGQLVQAGNWGGTTDQTTQQTSDQEQRREGTTTGTQKGTVTDQASPLDMFSTFAQGMSFM